MFLKCVNSTDQLYLRNVLKSESDVFKLNSFRSGQIRKILSSLQKKKKTGAKNIFLRKTTFWLISFFADEWTDLSPAEHDLRFLTSRKISKKVLESDFTQSNTFISNFFFFSFFPTSSSLSKRFLRIRFTHPSKLLVVNRKNLQMSPVLVVKAEDSGPRGRGFKSWRDHFQCTIHLDQSMDTKSCWKL